MADAMLADFLPHVGESFRLGWQDTHVLADLTAAEAIPGSVRAGGGFRLEFLGPADPILPQAIMAVTGPAGQHDIFVVPIARQAEGVRYEAVFY